MLSSCLNLTYQSSSRPCSPDHFVFIRIEILIKCWQVKRKCTFALRTVRSCWTTTWTLWPDRHREHDACGEFSVLLTPWLPNKELLKSFKLHLMRGLPASRINLRDENEWDETIEFPTKIAKKTLSLVSTRAASTVFQLAWDWWVVLHGFT